VRQILWLGQGSKWTTPDGHIDDLARFVRERAVVTVVEEKRNQVRLSGVTQGILRSCVFNEDRRRAAGSFRAPDAEENRGEDLVFARELRQFLYRNNCVLLPTFADPMDEPAREDAAKIIPDRKVIGIDCRELIWAWARFIA